MTSFDWKAVQAEAARQRAAAVDRRRDERFAGDSEFLYLLTAAQEQLDRLAQHPRLQHPMMPLTPEWKAVIDAGAELRAQAFAAEAYAFEPDRKEALRHALAMVRAHLSGEVVDGGLT